MTPKTKCIHIYSEEIETFITKKGACSVLFSYPNQQLFVGSDWQGTDKWNKIEEELAKMGCRVEYLPHTDGISSTMLRDKLNK